MKLITLLLVMMFLVGCSPKVIRIDNPAAYQQQATVLEVPGQNTVQPIQTQNVTQEDVVKTTSKESDSSKISSSGTSTAGSTSTTTVIADKKFEYNISHCCEQGRMDISINAPENIYDIPEINEFILKTYQSNCNKFLGSTQHSIYLKFSDQGEGVARNNLISFTSNSYNQLITKGIVQNTVFNNCLRT